MEQFTKILALAILASFISFAQDSSNTKMEHNHKMKMGKDMHHDMKMDSSKTMKESIVREGKIDLTAIDENKDGKVYQDMMDWNVISDEAGKCPLCKMTLEEVSLKEAKENLVKHGFEVK